MLLAGRSPVRVPDEVDFFSLPNPSSCTRAPGSTQPLIKMSTRNLPGGKKRSVRRADSLAAIYEPNENVEPRAVLRASTACTGINLPYLFLKFYHGSHVFLRATTSHVLGNGKMHNTN
jgi:hypothetical protein